KAAAAIRVKGSINLVLIALIVGAILMSATWKSGIAFDVYGTRLALESTLRDAALVVLALASLILTPDEHREANGFSWEPIREVAGGDAGRLMGEMATTLAAISMGAVYMVALTYIGNAPNLMIYAIASERGVKMPSFFGYMLWSCAVLLPVLVLLTFVSFGRP